MTPPPQATMPSHTPETAGMPTDEEEAAVMAAFRRLARTGTLPPELVRVVEWQARQIRAMQQQVVALQEQLGQSAGLVAHIMQVASAPVPFPFLVPVPSPQHRVPWCLSPCPLPPCPPSHGARLTLSRVPC